MQGPKPSPRQNKDSTRMAAVKDTSNSFAISAAAGVIKLLPQVTAKPSKPELIVWKAFFEFDQFKGLSGSSGPSQSNGGIVFVGRAGSASSLLVRDALWSEAASDGTCDFSFAEICLCSSVVAAADIAVVDEAGDKYGDAACFSHC